MELRLQAYMYVCTCVYIYIYIERERERERAVILFHFIHVEEKSSLVCVSWTQLFYSHGYKSLSSFINYTSPSRNTAY